MQTQPPSAVHQQLQLVLSRWKWKVRDVLPLVQINSLSLSKVCCFAMTTKAAHIQIHWWAGRLSSTASCRLKALSNHFWSTSLTMTLWDLFRQRHNHDKRVRPHLHRKVPLIASFIHVNNGPFLQIEPPIAVLLTFNLIFKVQKLAFFLLRNISDFKFWFISLVVYKFTYLYLLLLPHYSSIKFLWNKARNFIDNVNDSRMYLYFISVRKFEWKSRNNQSSR